MPRKCEDRGLGFVPMRATAKIHAVADIDCGHGEWDCACAACRVTTRCKCRECDRAREAIYKSVAARVKPAR
jgi:hypothetical protein